MAGSRWSADDNVARGADYDARWARLAERGESIHGEADLVMRFSPASVLDAGCGTGRVAIELARRGIDAVGADLDEPMLEQARAKAPELTWHLADLTRLDLDQRFDVVVMAGNVMIFVLPGTESQVVANMARHLDASGHLIAGFQLTGAYDADQYDRDCEAAGLERVARYSTWAGDEWASGADYAVSVHRRAVM